MSALRKAIQREPGNSLARLHLCSTYEAMGRKDEAQALVSEVYEINPKFSLLNWEKTLPFRDKEFKKRYIDSLRKAGLK